jgi:hypothetical protein
MIRCRKFNRHHAIQRHAARMQRSRRGAQGQGRQASASCESILWTNLSLNLSGRLRLVDSAGSGDADCVSGPDVCRSSDPACSAGWLRWCG